MIVSWIFSIAGNRNCAFSLASALDNVIIIFRRLLLSVFSFVKRKTFSNGYNKSNETRRGEEKGCEDLEVSDEDECSKFAFLDISITEVHLKVSLGPIDGAVAWLSCRSTNL